MTIADMKLGKQPARYNRQTPLFANYVDGSLPPAPDIVGWLYKIKTFPMFMNDKIGDCTIAGAAHMEQVWSAYATRQFVATDPQVLSAYRAVSGYDPKFPSTDQGAVELDVLNYWVKTGIAGHTIEAYAALQQGNITELKDSVWLFGGAYLGVQLPLTAQDQPSTWSVVANAGPDAKPGSWGGHCVNVVQVDPRGITFVSWGQLMRMTLQFYKKYCDEAYCVLSKDWIAPTGVAPSHLNLDALRADMALVTRAV